MKRADVRPWLLDLFICIAVGWVGLWAPMLAYADAFKTDRELFEKVESSYGRILPPSETSATLGVLQDGFQDLVRAQDTMIPLPNARWRRTLHIVDSPVLNAFVAPVLPNSSVEDAAIHVFVTRGLLDSFLDGSNEVSFRQGLEEVEGILAHELGHPLNDFDPVFRNRVNVPQAVEVRADTDGARILKKAGLPPERLSQALARIQRSGWSLLEAAAASHPEDQLRQSLQRQTLTLLRYQEGAPVTVRKATQLPVGSVLAELHRLSLPWEYKRPASVRENAERLSALLGKASYTDSEKIEFNRLLLSLHQKLEADPKNLSEAERQDVLRTFESLYTESHPEIFHREDFAKRFSRVSGSRDFVGLARDHFDLLYKTPFFGEPAYQDAIEKLIRQRRVPGSFPFEREFEVLPAKAVVDRFRPEVASRLRANVSDLHAKDGWDPVNQKEAYDRLPKDIRARIAEVYSRDVAPGLAEDSRLVFEHAVEGLSVFDAIVPTKKESSVAAYAGRPLPKENDVSASYRSVLQRIWEDRGFYGLLDIITDNRPIDWPLIWRTLGIDPDTGRSQLIHAVKAYTKGNRYPKLVEAAPTIFGFRGQKPEHFRNPSKPGRLDWADDTLLPYLQGEFNPALRGRGRKVDPGFRLAPEKLGDFPSSKADLNPTRYVAARYLIHKPELVEREFIRGFDDAVANLGHPPSLRELAEIVDRIRVERLAYVDEFQAGYTRLIAKAVDRSRLPPGEKAALLRKVYLQSGKSPEVGFLPSCFNMTQTERRALGWIDEADPATTRQVFAILKKNGAVQSSFDLVDHVLSLPNLGVGSYDLHFSLSEHAVSPTLEVFHEEIARELEQAAAAARSPEERDRVLARMIRYVSQLKFSGPSVARLKKVLLDYAERIPLASSKRWEVFIAATEHLGNSDTDRFFRKYFLEDLKSGRLSEAFKKELTKRYDRRVISDELQLASWREAFDAKFAEGGAVVERDSAKLKEAFEFVQERLPEGRVRDEYLEELAWRHHLKGESLELLERYKTNAWRANEFTIHFGSDASVGLDSLDEATLVKLLRHLASPEKNAFPRKEITARLVAALSQKRPGVNAAESARESASVARAADSALRDLERDILKHSPVERIPMAELLLAKLDKRSGGGTDFSRYVLGELLGYPTHSNDAKLTRAFLKSVPEHEQLPTLAYLLVHKDTGASSLRERLQVFQTVGYKGGQLASYFDVPDHASAMELARLKDRAPPLSKKEVADFLKKTLTPEEWGMIVELEQVRGSASIKCVVEAKLRDGRRVVFAIQRPHARELVATNLALSERFLRQARAEGLELPKGMFQTISADLKEQLDEELRMLQEAEKTDLAREYAAAANRKRAAGDYTVEVPALAEGFQRRENLLVFDLASGVSWSQLPLSDRAGVGKIVVHDALEQLFEKGWFDPDRHSGNVLIDTKIRKIFAIDFGQATSFKKGGAWVADDRYILAQFLRGLDERNPDRLAEFTLKMARNPKDVDRAALGRAIREALGENADGNLYRTLVSLMNKTSDTGLSFQRKFSFGALKGLLVLSAEKYVPERELAGLLESSIRATIRGKPGLAVLDFVKNGCVRAVLNALRPL